MGSTLSQLGDNQVDGKRIAKNTIFLYFRMLLIMGVTLITSRVVLDKLGASDYGIYGSVGGVVAMLSFLNGTLSTGSSRFLTFELSKGNFDRLKATFNTASFSHLVLALIVAIVLEAFGLWFISNKLIIPPDRLFAAEWVFHISVFTTCISIIQVPYTSVIIAHENMSIYAYVGIFEALSKLSVIFLLSIAPFDKMIFYAALMALIQFFVAVFNSIYSMRHYNESRIELKMDRVIFKEMLSYSGWSLLANISQILSSQGFTLIMNMFFQPVVVAAQTIGNNLSNAMMSFVNNFRTAINPQIIKSYALGSFSDSRKLTLETSIYVYELVLLFALPMVVLMEPLLNLWLVEVPDYTVIFSQFIVISQLFNVYNGSLYLPMMASGILKENSYASIIITIIGCITLYVLFKIGFDVMWIQYINIFQISICGLIIKPVILCKYIPDYTWKMIFENEWTCIKVSFFPIIIALLTNHFINVQSFVDMVAVTVIICSSVFASALYFMDKYTRSKLLSMLKIKMQEIFKK